MTQQTTFEQELEDLTTLQEVAANSAIKTLHPFIDKEGLLRVGGRLQQSILPCQTTYQMISLQIIILINCVSRTL